MEGNKLLTLLVTMTVGIIFIGALLGPVINDVSATEKTFTNDGYYRMTNTDEETVITWTPSVDPFTITVNGEDISLDSLKQHGYSNYSIAFSEDFILRYYYETASVQNLQVWKSAYVVGIGSTSPNTATITINSDGLTWSTNAADSTPQTVAHTGSYFVIDPAGDYSMKYREDSAYVHPDSSIIYAGGLSLISGTTFSGLYFEGTVENITVTPMNSNTTATNIQTYTTPISGYVNLYGLEKVTFTTTYAATNPATDREQTYSYFLVPYEVTAEMSQHLDAGEIAILAAIPLMAIAALILLVVRYFVAGRD